LRTDTPSSQHKGPTGSFEQVPPYYVGDTGQISDQISVLSWSIPGDIGLWITRIVPIPVAPSIQALLGDTDKAGAFGVVAVLFNEGSHLPNHAAEAGHRALNSAVEAAINTLLRTLGPTHPSITQDDINGIAGNVSQQVHNAIVNDLSFWEKLWALTEADIEIGQQIWNWDQDIVIDPNGQITFATGDNWSINLWTDPFHGRWRISGKLNISDPCPADVFAYLLSRFLGDGSSQSSPAPAWHDAMRAFRDNGGLASQPGLSTWWELAAEHVPYFAALAANREDFREAVIGLLNALPRMLAEPDSPLPRGFLDDSRRVLSIITESPHTDLRAAGVLGVSLLEDLQEKTTVRQGLAAAAATGAAVYKQSRERPAATIGKTGHAKRKARPSGARRQR
jgi:hypothetical protein